MDASDDGHPGKLSQIERFKQAARALECDEDEDAFKAKLRKVATAPKPAGKGE